MLWCSDSQLPVRLNARLLEARVDPPSVGNLELGVQVRLPVYWVDEPVQAFARPHVWALRFHDHGIAGGKIGELDSGAVEHCFGIKLAAVMADRRDSVRDQVQPAGGADICRIECDRGP